MSTQDEGVSLLPLQLPQPYLLAVSAQAYHELERENKTLQETNRAHQKTNRMLHETIRTHQKMISTDQETIHTLQDTIQTSNYAMDALEREVFYAHTVVIATLEQENKDLQEKLDAATKQRARSNTL